MVPYTDSVRTQTRYGHHIIYLVYPSSNVFIKLFKTTMNIVTKKIKTTLAPTIRRQKPTILFDAGQNQNDINVHYKGINQHHICM